MSYRSPVTAALMPQNPASPAYSTGSTGRVAHPTPVDSLPLYASTSRLARSASNASSAAGAASSPAAAAGARGGTANLPPADAAYQQLLTPTSFGRSSSSSRRMGAFAACLSPGIVGGVPLSGVRPRSVEAAAAVCGAALNRHTGSGYTRRLSAPTGYSESGASEAAAPSFSLRAPSGLSSDEEDEADSSAAAASRRRRSSISSAVLGGVRPLTPAEQALAEVTAKLETQLRFETQKKVAAFDRALLDIEVDEASALAAVEAQRAKAAAQQAAAEAAAAAARQQQRRQLLSGLRSQHQQKAAEGERKVLELEAAVKQQQEAAAAAAKAEADKKAAAEAAAKAEAKRQRESAAQKAAADKAAAEAAAAAVARRKEAAAVQASGLRIAPSAAEWEKQCAEALAAAQAAVKPFVDDRAMRDKKRSIDKFITLNVQQISATLEQVRLKAEALVGFIAAQHGAQTTYALLTLTNKLVSQCEVQVTRLHAFAFPLAEVAVAVMAAHPAFVPLLVARLHQVCPLSVPKYVVFKSGSGQDEDAYLKQLGYKISTDEDTGQVTRETTDEFVGRMQGYLLLYAAIAQSDNPRNPHGLANAWALLARLLNALPANRLTATIVDSMLKVAGFRMYQVYRGQFIKLLQYIDREFLPSLGTSNDPDARAVYTRIQTYLKTAQYNQPPEGRDMPQFDTSSYDRA